MFFHKVVSLTESLGVCMYAQEHVLGVVWMLEVNVGCLSH